MLKISRSILISLCFLLLAACASPGNSPVTPVTPPVAAPKALNPTTYFRIDIETGTVTVVDGPDAGLANQTYYVENSGVRYAVTVAEHKWDMRPSILTLKIDVTNLTPQTFLAQGIDNAQLILPFFQSWARVGDVAVPIPGGGITNVEGYKAESLFPFVTLKEDIAPGATSTIFIDMTIPQETAWAGFGLQLQATSAGTNHQPGPNSGWVTALVGQYGVTGNINGPGHAARVRPKHVAACGDTLYFADNTNLVKRYRQNLVSEHTSSGLADVAGLACFFGTGLNDRLIVSDWVSHQIKFLHPNGGVAEIVGSGTAGSANGNATTAQFRNPRSLAVIGRSVFVIEEAGSIRRLDFRNGVWQVSTLASGLGSLFDVTTDGTRHLYYTQSTANPGVYRLSTDGGTPVRIYANAAANFTWSSLVWDNAGGLILAERANHRLYHLTPTINANAWQGVILAGTGAAGSVGGGMATPNAPIFSPYGLAVDRSGTLYVASWDGYQLLRIDRQR